jgi:hypothetical protein
MAMRKLLLSILAVVSSGLVFAQDQIYKRDGTVVEARVRTVGDQSVIYVLYSDQHGAEYTLQKKEVDKIRYENGSIESFKLEDEYGARYGHPYENRPGKYKPHVLALAPIQFTENGIAGVSVSYECAIDKQGFAAFYLPAILEFNTTQQNTNNSDPMFYLMPGIKIYPTGSFGTCKYAIGPSFVIADGQKTAISQDINYNNIYTEQSHFLMGIMVNQSVNINPTPHLYLGTEFGLGYTYIDEIGGSAHNASVLVNFSFKLGFRY